MKTTADQAMIAVDLGGTHVRAALVGPDGTLLEQSRERTRAEAGPKGVVEQIAALVRSLGPLEPGVRAPMVAVAAPGPLNPARGVVYATPNLAGWHDFELAAALETELALAVKVHNDANLAALGEALRGAARDCGSSVYLTVSTGVGGGVVQGGGILEGAHGLAGELGHMIVRAGGPACNFGHAGCLEGLASGTAIARAAAERLASGESSLLASLTGHGEPGGAGERRPPTAGATGRAAGGRAGGNGGADTGRTTGDEAAPEQEEQQTAAPTAEQVAEAARQGDALASDVLTAAAADLGLAIGSLINAFDPDVVVVGGGVSASWDLIAEPIERACASVVMAPDHRSTRIVRAELGDDAGLVGAGLWAWSFAAKQSTDG